MSKTSEVKKNVSEATKVELLAINAWLNTQIKNPATSDYNRGWNDVILDLKNEVLARAGVKNEELDTPKTPPI